MESHPSLASVCGDQVSFRTSHSVCYIDLCHFDKSFLEEARSIPEVSGNLFLHDLRDIEFRKTPLIP